jgi:hypothetical protein
MESKSRLLSLETGRAHRAKGLELTDLRTGLEEISQAGTMRVGGHRGLDLQRQRQRFAALT